jgi:DNA-directed RNA polymerase sigma subunit (sigma70/sigma32)
MTLEQIGALLGITRERVRQIKEKHCRVSDM